MVTKRGRQVVRILKDSGQRMHRRGHRNTLLKVDDDERHVWVQMNG